MPGPDFSTLEEIKGPDFATLTPIGEVPGFEDLSANQPLRLNLQSGRVTPPGMTTSGGPRVPLASYAETAASLQEADTPLTRLIAPRPSPFEPRVSLPKVPIASDAGFWKAAGSEAVNALEGVPEFFTSDAGILSVLGARLSPRLVSAGFSADMTLSAFQQAKQAYQNWDKMTPAEKGKATVDILASTVLSGLTGAHAAGVKLPSLRRAEQPLITPPITGEALRQPAARGVPTSIGFEGEQVVPKAAELAPTEPPPVAPKPPAPEAEVAPAPAVVPARDWDLLYENLTDELDSFNPARSTGRINYELNDVAQRFVDYAKADKSGKPVNELVADFAKTDEASKGQISKLRQSVQSIIAQEQKVAPAPPAETVEGKAAEIEREAKSIADAIAERKRKATSHYQYDFQVEALNKLGLNPEEFIDNPAYQKLWSDPDTKANRLQNSAGFGLLDIGIDPKTIADAIRSGDISNLPSIEEAKALAKKPPPTPPAAEARKGEGVEWTPSPDFPLSHREPERIAEVEAEIERRKSAVDQADKEAEPFWEKVKEAEKKLANAKRTYDDTKIQKAEASLARAKKKWQEKLEVKDKASSILDDAKDAKWWESATPFQKWVWRMQREYLDLRDKEGNTEDGRAGPQATKFRNRIIESIEKQWEQAIREAGHSPEEARNIRLRRFTLADSVFSDPLNPKNDITKLGQWSSKTFREDNIRDAARKEIDKLELPRTREVPIKIEDWDTPDDVAKKVEQAKQKAKDFARSKAEEARKAEEANRKAAEEELQTARRLQSEGKLVWRMSGGDAGKRWTPVSGKAVKIPEAASANFWIYKGGDGWVVIEDSTGHSIGNGKTQADAIADAKAKITKAGAQKFYAMVQKAQPDTPKPTLKEPTPAAPAPGTKVKEPWEMSAKEYGKFYHETPSEVARVGNFPGLAHKQAVREAIREGKIFEHPDYPDLTPSKQLTPLQKQWRAIKDQVPNKLVLVRLGDFYEAFYGDAKTLSEVGKIALTKRNEVPMAGVPYHAAESYINKLKAAGHDVEVVEDYRTWKAPGTKEGMGGPGSPSVEQGPDRPGGPGWPQSVNEDIMGVRQVTREKQAAVGQPVVATPGEGTNLEKSLADGRARLIRDPAEAERVRQNFDRTGQLSPEDFNVARAKYEQVMAEGRKVAQQHGTMSEEYFKARMEAYTWSDLTKRMQTAWHKLGMGQQGETDIDTGEILDLENEYHDKTGKNFTPGQRKTGKKIADSNKKAKTATAEAKGKLNKHLVAKTTSMSSAESQAQKAVWRWHRMNATTIAGEEMAARGDIWIKAKEYIEKGWDDFDDIRKKLATDLGMPIEQVTRLLAQDKRAKYLADDVWRKQQTERHLKSQAKRWVQAQATPLLNRSLQSIPRAMFGLKVGFHGTVALGTHAPTVAFQPRFWANYVRDFGKMYKMVGSKAYYENQVQDLLRRDNYVVANRAGLVNDPFVYEDYNSPDTAKYFGALTGMGNRGYSVLKILRQDMFDQFWNHLPKSQQIPEMAQALADGINHATGVVKGRAPRGTNLAFFAPRLEASRVMWLAGDPGKAIGTLLNWNKASMGDKYFAMNQLKEKAWVIGTLGSLLALNQGFLSATGSEQKINVTNPFGSDFLKFKVSGMNLSYGNPMITMARLPLRLFVAVENEGKLNKMVYEDENVATVLFEYVRSQMSPFAGTITDLGIGRDYMRKPLPRAAFGLLPGKKNLPRRLREEGIHPYSWPEYASEQLAMIPVQEALKEVWGKDLVMNAADRERSLKALATIIVMGGTGARVSQDYTLAPRRTPATTPSFNTILQEQPR